MSSKDCKAHFMATDNTKYYADSVEWCPFDHLCHYFACGTYQLDESSSKENQIRHGNVNLYKLNSNAGSCTPFYLSTIDTISTSGILDMKWCPSRLCNKIILSMVCSDGKLLLKYINEDDRNITLSHLTQHDFSEEGDKMLLSIDWSWQDENSASVITSDTKGHLNYLKLRENDIYVLNSWKAHNFEAWVSSFNYSDSNIIYSGGDDCCFKGWDVRNLLYPVFTNKRHVMGVTAIAKSKLNENILVTGSYDENIFLWDTRSMKSSLSEISVSGGVWRLKWHPSKPQYLLSAAMHNGFHVLSVNSDNIELELSYDQHKSLAYGVDWSYIPTESSDLGERGELLREFNKYDIKSAIASCSFYDNLLHVWGINL